LLRRQRRQLAKEAATAGRAVAKLSKCRVRLNLEELRGHVAAQYAVKVSNKFDALQECEDDRTPDELWQETKEIQLETAKETVGYARHTREKTYITEETCSLIRQKREAKQSNPQEYKRLKPIVQQKLREDKNKEIEQQCEELELASKRGNMRKLFHATRTLTKKF